MLPSTILVLFLCGIFNDVISTPTPPQAVLSVDATTPADPPAQPAGRKLRGRFLHVTDMHPDGYYRAGASVSSACHSNKPRKEKDRAGWLGTPYDECDSPFTLTNFTLKHLDKHWADEVDFVIWTGDSARHDNDREIPRTPSEIYNLNRAMTKRMEEVFTSRGVAVIPSIGNNDVWPHNIMAAGPNSITNEFSNIWQSFIPFSSFQVFQRGGYFSVEVIPNEVAVVSLNTMYFYDSNKAVGGCEYTEKEDPGNLEFDWLEVQLDLYRNRDMQVWISGHVPPSPGNYFPGCFVKYADLALRYQDTILGHLFGHMNADHFFFIEKDDLDLPEENSRARRKEMLDEALLNDFSELPKEGKTNLDEFAVVNVAPSVVPNPYVPSFRVFTYNVTGAEEDGGIEARRKKKKKKGSKRKHGHRRPEKDRPAKECKEKEERWECRPKKPWYSDASAPSRKNELWSPLGYAQYWLPDVGSANDTHGGKFKLEYLTYGLPSLRGDKPIPAREVPGRLRNGSYNGRLVPYSMDDLTIGSWVSLGRQLGNPKKRKLRKRFRRYLYLGLEDDVD
ncbi:hypothetical protein BD410DRAFT_26204 [Rickenella mellea]|uniref:Endopolyphosphatase n=1 Tax=Rickenella mellea TaxID=50990 RepID=A0A4V3AZK8_9AGAM|nr:hypothetical protein BD410DRAFT_26204 [Rickenella mellea]